MNILMVSCLFFMVLFGYRFYRMRNFRKGMCLRKPSPLKRSFPLIGFHAHQTLSIINVNFEKSVNSYAT